MTGAGGGRARGRLVHRGPGSSEVESADEFDTLEGLLAACARLQGRGLLRVEVGDGEARLVLDVGSYSGPLGAEAP